MRPPSRILMLGGCCLAFALACDKGSMQFPVERSPAPEVAPPARATVQLPGGDTIADVAARVTPSVVKLFSERQRHRDGSSPHSKRFFDVPAHRFWAERERSLGSGVIVSADGVILTNSHLVEPGDDIRVGLQDGRELEAELVGKDPHTDIAVLRVAAKDLRPIELADSSKQRVGDLVLAIGNPFGIGQTVTMGIVSAVGRADIGITDYEDFIQTDAAINPGNSGGALVDMNGRLVGINTAIVSRTGAYLGIGFAIPSNMAVQVKNAILADGKLTRGWLGVAVHPVTHELAASLNLEPLRGVVVSHVSEGSPAEKSGLALGDLITSIDGVQITTPSQLRNTVGFAGKGNRVRIELERDGKRHVLEPTLAEAPSVTEPVDQLDAGLLAGVTVQELDRATRRRLRIPSRVQGVVVAEVDPNSALSGLGLAEGDVLLEVNRTKTPTLDAFRKAAQASDSNMLVLVYRDGAIGLLSISR